MEEPRHAGTDGGGGDAPPHPLMSVGSSEMGCQEQGKHPSFPPLRNVKNPGLYSYIQCRWLVKEHSQCDLRFRPCVAAPRRVFRGKEAVPLFFSQERLRLPREMVSGSWCTGKQRNFCPGAVIFLVFPAIPPQYSNGSGKHYCERHVSLFPRITTRHLRKKVHGKKHLPTAGRVPRYAGCHDRNTSWVCRNQAGRCGSDGLHRSRVPAMP